MATNKGYIDGELKKVKEIYISLGSSATFTEAMEIYLSRNPDVTNYIPVDSKTQERLIWSLIADLDYEQQKEVLSEVLTTTTSQQCLYMIVSMLHNTSSSEHKDLIEYMLFTHIGTLQYTDFITAMIANSDSQKCKYMIASMLYNSMGMIHRIQNEEHIRQHNHILVSTLTNNSTTLENAHDATQRKIRIADMFEGFGADEYKDIILSLHEYTDWDVEQELQLVDYILHEDGPDAEQTENMIYSMLPYTSFQQRKNIIIYMITDSNNDQAKRLKDVLLKQTCDYQQRKEMIASICLLGCQNLDLLGTMVYSMLDNSEELHHGSMIRALLEVNPDRYFADGKFRYTLLGEVLYQTIQYLFSTNHDLSTAQTRAGKYPINPGKITGVLLRSESDETLLRYIADITRRDLLSSVKRIVDYLQDVNVVEQVMEIENNCHA